VSFEKNKETNKYEITGFFISPIVTEYEKVADELLNKITNNNFVEATINFSAEMSKLVTSKQLESG